MNPHDAINSIQKGIPLDCTQEEYQNEIRTALQNQAAKWIDQKQDVYAIIALTEVKRLDAKYGLRS